MTAVDRAKAKAFAQSVIEQQNHPPIALLILKRAYIRGGEDGLREACLVMPDPELAGIANWLGQIGSEFTMLSSLNRMAYLAAKQLCDRGQVYSIFDQDGAEKDSDDD